MYLYNIIFYVLFRENIESHGHKNERKIATTKKIENDLESTVHFVDHKII